MKISRKPQRLSKLFTIENQFIKQLKSDKYEAGGHYPVIDQSMQFICGYSNREELVRYDVPLIIFGDHTKVVKFIDFPFISSADGVQILKPVNGLSANYLYYLICDASKKIGNHGYTRHLKYLKSLQVNYISDANTQNHITQVLSLLDKQLQPYHIQSYNAIKEGMLQDLFTRGVDVTSGKLRAPASFNPELYTDSPIGLIPKNWQCVKLKSIISQVIDNRGKTPPITDSGEIELIETTSINGAKLAPDYTKVTKFISGSTYKNWFRNHLEQDDILVSTVGEYAGSTAILTQKRGAIAQNLVGLRVNSLIASPYYIYYWFKTDFFTQYLQQVIMNSAQPSLNVTHLLNFYIPIPPLSEQIIIAERLESIDKLVLDEIQILNKLQNIKQGLMDKFF